MDNQSIRIRLKAFDYRLIDASAKLIVETVKNIINMSENNCLIKLTVLLLEA